MGLVSFRSLFAAKLIDRALADPFMVNCVKHCGVTCGLASSGAKACGRVSRQGAAVCCMLKQCNSWGVSASSDQAEDSLHRINIYQEWIICNISFVKVISLYNTSFIYLMVANQSLSKYLTLKEPKPEIKVKNLSNPISLVGQAGLDKGVTYTITSSETPLVVLGSPIPYAYHDRLLILFHHVT